MRSSSLAALVLAALCASLPAQVTLSSGSYAGTGGESHKNVVTDGNGALYAITLEDVSGQRQVNLHVSSNGGQNWTPAGVTFNDAMSGTTGSNLTNACAMAIDDIGNLHVTWGNYYYPSYYNQYYRSFNLLTWTPSPITDITAAIGATNSTRTNAMNIAVDSGNLVYLVAHATTSWRDRLMVSTQPYAAGGTFADLGPVSPGSSAQSVRLAVDALGAIHCSYYRNISPGNYEHRIYDPVNGWQPSFTLGNMTPSNDLYGLLCADAQGNVHALYAKDSHSSSAQWEYRYRRWDPVAQWGPEVFVFDVTSAQFTGVANTRIAALACDEITGRAFVVHRDLGAGGQLRLISKGLSDATFDAGTDLTAPDPGQHAYYAPAIRGALYPASNRTGSRLDLTYRAGAVPGPYSQVFQGIDTDVSLALGAPPVIGTTVPLLLASAADALKTYVLGFSLGTSPGILLGAGRTIPLNYDGLMQLSLQPGNGFFMGNVAPFDAMGMGTATFLIPPAPWFVGQSVYAAFVVYDPGAFQNVGTISSALTITFQ